MYKHSKEGTNIEGVDTNKRENDHHMIHRWSWRRWLSRPFQEHMLSRRRTICMIYMEGIRLSGMRDPPECLQ